MARYVDLETGETLEGTIAREGDKIIRKESLQYKRLDIPFMRLHEFPTELTKTEQKIMYYVCNHNHLRGRDNAILTGNHHEIKKATDLGLQAGIKDKRQGRKAVESLIGRGIIAKYGGKFHLSWRVGTIGQSAIEKEIYNLFQ